jgi:hypothetical protein
MEGSGGLWNQFLTFGGETRIGSNMDTAMMLAMMWRLLA